MYYKRTVSIPYKRLLSRNELRVFTSCRTILKLEDIVDKAALPENEVVEIMNTFISEGLVNKFDSYDSAQDYEENEKSRLDVTAPTSRAN